MCIHDGNCYNLQQPGWLKASLLSQAVALHFVLVVAKKHSTRWLFGLTFTTPLQLLQCWQVLQQLRHERWPAH